MKYQLVIDYAKIWSNQAFEAVIAAALARDPVLKHAKIIEARSLDGVREEVWQAPKKTMAGPLDDLL